MVSQVCYLYVGVISAAKWKGCAQLGITKTTKERHDPAYAPHYQCHTHGVHLLNYAFGGYENA